MAYHDKFDVFFSFKSEDTRHGFLSHLITAFDRHGIIIFKDTEDKSLPRGELISAAIKRGIQNSRLSFILFSKNYAASTWCLEELVEIMDRWKDKKQIVVPIFLDVRTSEVREQSGDFGLAFVEHEKKLSLQQIQSWKLCLTTAADIAGWSLGYNEDEAKFIEKIEKDVMRRLSQMSSKQSCELVGIDSRKKKIRGCLALDSDDVRMVGICGDPGIGKTTLARFIYNEISGKFDGFCFLEDVREKVQIYGLDFLQCQLVWEVKRGRITSEYGVMKDEFRPERVLIVLDDVDHIEQLKKLAVWHDWFGPGSRIIITTRDKHLLRAHEVCEIYDVERLYNLESLELFYKHAFRNRDATDEFANLAPIIVNHARKLPLVVKVLGSSLYGKSISEWENKLTDLNRNNWEVPDLLSICFGKLHVAQKKIFLDIACFFKGYYTDIVAKYLDICGISTEIGVKALCDKCFISISNKRIWIHDLQQEMAHEVVRQQTNEAATYYRLWDSEDVDNVHVLSENEGIEKVEIMILNSSKMKDVSSLPSVIAKMSNLRLLKIYSSTNSGSNTLQVPPCRLKGKYIRYFTSFSKHLICFRWEGYPLKHLPKDFHPQNLIELYMPHSNLKRFSTNEKRFEKLMFIDLSFSKNLIETPDFSETPNLEKLILEDCTNLTKVHSSIASHKSLQMVNMKDCTSFCKFPSPIEMKVLKIFILSGCSKLQEFPKIQRNMECLLELHVDGTAIKRLPKSSKMLSGLKVLYCDDCQDLTAVGHLSNLRIIKKPSGNKEESSWSKRGMKKFASVVAAAGGAS